MLKVYAKTIPMNKVIIFLGLLALANAYPDEILRWKSLSYKDPPKKCK